MSVQRSPDAFVQLRFMDAPNHLLAVCFVVVPPNQRLFVEYHFHPKAVGQIQSRCERFECVEYLNAIKEVNSFRGSWILFGIRVPPMNLSRRAPRDTSLPIYYHEVITSSSPLPVASGSSCLNGHWFGWGERERERNVDRLIMLIQRRVTVPVHLGEFFVRREHRHEIDGLLCRTNCLRRETWFWFDVFIPINLHPRNSSSSALHLILIN